MTQNGCSILVVDDVSANVRLLEAILEPEGYVVVAAGSGAEALDAIEAHPIDLVLLDVNMPGMNGHEVCRRIREGDPDRLLPIVMVTAGADESATTAVESGADDLITRPFDQSELLARVKSLLRVKQLHDVVEAQAAELSAVNDTLQTRVDEQLRELLGLRRLQRFLSPQLADVVLSAGDEALLQPHRREIAVVFGDLRGFTRFTGSAEPEELLDVLREFHGVLGALVDRHDATVGHFAGDGVMLFFNDPVPCDDPALKAASLAVELRDAFRPLRVGWQARGHDLDIGIGLALGFATLGTIGFEGRYDYSALGTVVNIASRLCGAAAPGEVLAGPRAHAAIEQFVDAEPREPVEAKGFTEPIPAWRIVSLIASRDTGSGPGTTSTDVRILGPLEVLVDGAPVDLASASERALVARLAVDLNHVVPVERLIEDVWGSVAPETAAASLHADVSRVREALVAAGARALVVTRPPGYLLEADPSVLDLSRFEALVEAARSHLAGGAPDRAVSLLAEALAQWRGPALPEVADGPAMAPIVRRLEELRQAAVDARREAELRCDRPRIGS